MAQIDIIKQRIRERLEALKLTARGVSLRATNRADAVNNILNKDAMPTFERLEAIAKELGCSVKYLTGSSDVPALDPWDVAVGANPVVARSDMNRDLPVYESARYEGPEIGPAVTKGQIDFGRITQFFFRPPYLTSKKKAYAVFAPVGTASPALDIGQAAIMDPARPAGAGDLVIVYLNDGYDRTLEFDEWQPRPAIFGRLLLRADEHAVVEIFNPTATVTVKAQDMTGIHRIVPLAELLGMA